MTIQCIVSSRLLDNPDEIKADQKNINKSKKRKQEEEDEKR